MEFSGLLVDIGDVLLINSDFRANFNELPVEFNNINSASGSSKRFPGYHNCFVLNLSGLKVNFSELLFEPILTQPMDHGNDFLVIINCFVRNLKGHLGPAQDILHLDNLCQHRRKIPSKVRIPLRKKK